MTESLSQQIYFKRLILSNVRSFGDEQHLDMIDGEGRPAQWTLILGENGVGKTTILQCLASMSPVLAVPEVLGGQSGNLTASEPTGVEPAILRREDNELVALARSGQEHVTLKVELASGQAFGPRNGKPSDFSLEASIKVKGGELIDAQRTTATMARPVEPLIIGYSAARHMRYGRGETLALHPEEHG